jgi:hypothetical protein
MLLPAPPAATGLRRRLISASRRRRAMRSVEPTHTLSPRNCRTSRIACPRAVMRASSAGNVRSSSKTRQAAASCANCGMHAAHEPPWSQQAELTSGGQGRGAWRRSLGTATMTLLRAVPVLSNWAAVLSERHYRLSRGESERRSRISRARRGAGSSAGSCGRSCPRSRCPAHLRAYSRPRAGVRDEQGHPLRLRMRRTWLWLARPQFGIGSDIGKRREAQARIAVQSRRA